MGWDGMGWDGMGWDGMGWDGMGWDGIEFVFVASSTRISTNSKLPLGHSSMECLQPWSSFHSSQSIDSDRNLTNA